MLCWENTLGGWAWAGRLVISVVQEGHDGDLDQVVAVEMVKMVDSGDIFGGRINRISRKITSELWGKEAKNDPKRFCLSEWKATVIINWDGETFRASELDLACWVWDI